MEGYPCLYLTHLRDFLPDLTGQRAPLPCLFAMVTACEFACLCHIHTLCYLELSSVDLKALCKKYYNNQSIANRK